MQGSWLIWIKKKNIVKGNIYLLYTLPDDIYNPVMTHIALAEIDCKHISAEQAFK